MNFYKLQKQARVGIDQSGLVQEMQNFHKDTYDELCKDIVQIRSVLTSNYTELDSINREIERLKQKRQKILDNISKIQQEKSSKLFTMLEYLKYYRPQFKYEHKLNFPDEIFQIIISYLPLEIYSEILV